MLASGNARVLVSVRVKQGDDWTILKPQCALLSLLAGDADQLSPLSVLNHSIGDYDHDGDGDSHWMLFFFCSTHSYKKAVYWHSSFAPPAAALLTR